MRKKQHANLDYWYRVEGSLNGEVSNHPAFDDGERIVTSTVLSPPDSIKEGKEVETRNTIYKLGPRGSRKSTNNEESDYNYGE